MYVYIYRFNYIYTCVCVHVCMSLSHCDGVVQFSSKRLNPFFSVFEDLLLLPVGSHQPQALNQVQVPKG